MKILTKIMSLLIVYSVFFLCMCNGGNDESTNSTYYSIGDRGPAGGIIFYSQIITATRWKFFEAMPYDQSSNAGWGCVGTIINGADGLSLGDGYQNTIDIETTCITFGTAADLCANLTYSGYNDWYLPSDGELFWMILNLKSKGFTLANGNYWSSSEIDANNASTRSTTDYYYYNSSKNTSHPVRAIRSF